jgi:hypothetical protein
MMPVVDITGKMRGVALYKKRAANIGRYPFYQGAHRANLQILIWLGAMEVNRVNILQKVANIVSLMLLVHHFL